MSSCRAASSASTKSGTVSASSASRSRAMSWCRVSAIWRWRSQSSERFFAVVMSQAPGLFGTPSFGQCSSAATSASCASSSATPRSRTRRATAATMRADSRRQTVAMVWWTAECTGWSLLPGPGKNRHPGPLPHAGEGDTHSHLRRCGGFVHPEHLPLVAVEVGEAVLEHEAVVLRRVGRGGARGHGLAHHFLGLGAAVHRQGDQHLGALVRVAQGLLGEALEEGLDQQHGEEVFADFQAGALLVGEALVEREAQGLEEGLRTGHVLDGQVDEDLAEHAGFSLLGAWFVGSVGVIRASGWLPSA